MSVNDTINALLPNNQLNLITPERLREAFQAVLNIIPFSGDQISTGFTVGSVNSVVTCNNVFAANNTVPASGGSQVVSVTMTPLDSNSELEVVYSVSGSTAQAHGITAGVFQTGDTNALNGSISMSQTDGFDERFSIHWSFLVSAGSTAERTFSLNLGPNEAGTVFVNGDGNGNQLYGGAMSASIMVREILANA